MRDGEEIKRQNAHNKVMVPTQVTIVQQRESFDSRKVSKFLGKIEFLIK